MRIGLITQLLWDRYGPFWKKLLEAAGAEVLVPDSGRVRGALADPRLDSISALAFRIAVAQAIVLAEADLVIVPDLSGGVEVDRGSGQDPWVANLSETLRATVGGLPRLVSVPAELSPIVESRAIEILLQVVHDPAQVRRIWDRNRAAARPERRRDSNRDPAPGRSAVGVVGQPWLLEPPLLQVLRAEGAPLLAQSRFDPEELRIEGGRLGMALMPTDREVLGAARLLARRGDVERLLVVQDRSSADDWLLRAVQRLSRKPVEGRLLEDLPGAGVDPLLESGDVSGASG